jgi:hypothetical protein
VCGDLDKILSFLSAMGKDLYDHYNAIRFVCLEIHRVYFEPWRWERVSRC